MFQLTFNCQLPNSVKDSANAYYLSGVVSYGLNGCKGKGVYTRVSAYEKWIQATVSANMGAVTTVATTTGALAAGCGSAAVAPITTGLKIVGGVEARANSWPWQVMLSVYDASGNRFLCGGAVISNQVGEKVSFGMCFGFFLVIAKPWKSELAETELRNAEFSDGFPWFSYYIKK